MEVEVVREYHARLERTHVKSELLKNNRAGVDCVRPLTVFLPEEARDPERRFPVLYCLAPWTSAGRTQFDWQPFKESLFDRLSRLILAKAIAPCVVVAPDLFTDFGGSQYVNSEFLGDHASHLVRELVPFVESRYPVLPGAEHRGVFGRSSGGFGALRLAMDFPGEFGAIACHSGDMGFEWVYRRELIGLATGLARYGGDIGAFLDEMAKAAKVSGHEVHLLMLLGMAATYSPNLRVPEGFDLPIDLRTGRLDEDVWGRWLAHDPVVMAARPDVTNALKRLKCLYIDCGNRDQYYLQFGARQLVAKLEGASVPHRYYEFDDNHSGTSYRYDVSLPLLLEALA